MKAISADFGHPNTINLWIIGDTKYQLIRIDMKNNIEIIKQIPKDRFENLEHFVAVMGKFNPEDDFVIPPKDLPDPITYAAALDFKHEFERRTLANLTMDENQ
jgi:hypothetical protein